MDRVGGRCGQTRWRRGKRLDARCGNRLRSRIRRRHSGVILPGLHLSLRRRGAGGRDHPPKCAVSLVRADRAGGGGRAVRGIGRAGECRGRHISRCRRYRLRVAVRTVPLRVDRADQHVRRRPVGEACDIVVAGRRAREARPCPRTDLALKVRERRAVRRWQRRNGDPRIAAGGKIGDGPLARREGVGSAGRGDGLRVRPCAGAAGVNGAHLNIGRRAVRQAADAIRSSRRRAPRLCRANTDPVFQIGERRAVVGRKRRDRDCRIAVGASVRDGPVCQHEGARHRAAAGRHHPFQIGRRIAEVDDRARLRVVVPRRRAGCQVNQRRPHHIAGL